MLMTGVSLGNSSATTGQAKKCPSTLSASWMSSLSLALLASVAALAPESESAPLEGEGCGLWLGPSPIKEAEDHGWGHSVFTGKFIPKGAPVLSSGGSDDLKGGKVPGDLFVPVYDWEAMDTGASVQYGDDGDDDDDEADGGAGGSSNPWDGVQKDKDDDPMLFQELWNGDVYPHLVLESREGMTVYMPGLSNLCPCAAEGFNLEQVKRVTYRDWRNGTGDSRDETPPPPQAGSFSYLSVTMFVASRDIQPGEELVVECVNNYDEFDPGDYPPSQFKPKEAGGYSICLDDKVEVRLADHTPNVAGGVRGGQRGLFAKRKLEQGEILASTPTIAVHREEMTMGPALGEQRKLLAEVRRQKGPEGNFPLRGPGHRRQQLLMNYMFGHDTSSLLWLPLGPLFHAVNHASHNQDPKLIPNAKVQWHHDEYSDAQAAGKPLTRRQQFHHAELLGMDSLEVLQKHGMGLMIDLVATRPIQENDEILIDYGKYWDDAWEEHTRKWEIAVQSIKLRHRTDEERRKRQHRQDRERRQKRAAGNDDGGMSDLDDEDLHHHRQRDVGNSMTASPPSSYATADEYNRLHREDEVRTVSEQRRNPYPSNLETACHFEYDWLDDDIDNDRDAEKVTYESWYNQDIDFETGCLLPCIITERRDYVPGEYKAGKTYDDDDYEYHAGQEGEGDGADEPENGGSFSPKRYTAKLMDTFEGNTSINFKCHLYQRFEYIYMDIPREGILFVDKPQTTDQWIEQAFRRPIGLPEEMVPRGWRDMVQGGGMRGAKKKSKPPPSRAAEAEDPEERKYQQSIKRKKVVETRRERLEELGEKRFFVDYSHHQDL